MMSPAGLFLACYQLLTCADGLVQQIVGFAMISLQFVAGLLQIFNMCLMAWSNRS
jgi:hypothetical protein